MKGRIRFSSIRNTLATLVAMAALGGCFKDNSAPQITGNAPANVAAGDNYFFEPVVSDPDGDALSFSASGLPAWANFGENTGLISGWPDVEHIGEYSGITITVSDGEANSTLGPFTITVQAIGSGQATLSWEAPTQNEDGSALTDLAGYKIYWGRNSGSYPDSATIDNSSINVYVIDNLSSGSYEFVATSFNTAGVESAYSDPMVVTIQ